MDNFDAIFKGVNLLQAFLIVLAGFVDLTDSFKWIIQGVFLILFGSVVGALEVATMDIQPIVQKHASFLFSFMGRGVFSIFLGSLVLSNSTLSKLASAVLMLIGASYLALAFIPSVEPPMNMRIGGEDYFDDDEVEGIV